MSLVYVDNDDHEYVYAGKEVPSVATPSKIGLVRPDNETIFINSNGTIRAKVDGSKTYPVATETQDGLMSSSDKTKLDGLSTYPVASTSQNGLMSSSDKSKLDGLRTYSDATTSASGLMSGTDKTKLNSIDSGANKTVIVSNYNTKEADKGKYALDAYLGTELFQSVSDGKNKLVSAITDKGTTVTDTSFNGLATAIGAIKTGKDVKSGTLEARNPATTYSVTLGFKPSRVILRFIQSGTYGQLGALYYEDSELQYVYHTIGYSYITATTTKGIAITDTGFKFTTPKSVPSSFILDYMAY